MAEIIIKKKGFKCERCWHEWIPRNEEIPVICPKCKSPYWNKPKIRFKKEKEKNQKKEYKNNGKKMS